MYKSILLTSLVLLICVSVFAEMGLSPADKSEIETVINNYVNSTDTKNVNALDNLFYDNAIFLCVNKISNKVVECNKDAYIDQVQSGKTGGWARNLQIENVDGNDDTAMAKVVITDSKLKQIEYLSFAKVEGDWKIVSRTYTLELNK
jgi:hypothetical protein